MEAGRFETCYGAYRDYVKRLAYARLPDQGFSEDISQDVFLAFYLNLDRVPPGLEKAWLYRCARNKTIDYIRRECRHTELLYDPRTLSEVQTWISSEEDRADAKLLESSLLNEILRDLAQTHPIWFETVDLLHLLGYSYEETAVLLGVTTTVLRARMYRARVYVRDKYGAEYFEK